MNKRILVLAILIVCYPLFITTSAKSAADPFTLVIDAGHGGKDPGALGSIVREKDVVLDVALRFGQLVKRNHPDVKIIYTRNTDVFIPLERRAQIANNAKADLFISIHADWAESKSVHGASTFTLGQNRTKENFEIAKRENSVILLEENYEKRYEGFDPNSAESYIMFEFMQDNYMNQSIKFASEIQKRFKDSGRIDRGVRQDVFLVLRHTSMPSVLVELGFLTNPDEELFLKSDAGKDQQAESLLKAFTDFKNDYDRKSGVKLISDMPANSKNRKSTQRNSVQDSNSTHNTAQPEKIESELEEIANHTNKSGIDFRIQLVSSSTKIPKNDERLKGYQLDYYYEKGYYKYTYGSFSTFSEANKKRRELSASFPEAFVIAFRNGQRMPVNEARNLLSK